jgi:DNA-binding transcriptional LysR family regulator
MTQGLPMTNIPTDLLRALIAVVDHGGFTKAAGALGVTQPAVSTQLKRLQALLGCDVLDRSSHEIKLTPLGELVASHARRLLSLNDQIVRIGSAGPRPELQIRVGTPSDAMASRLPNILARFRQRWPDTRFSVCTGHFDDLIRDLHGGELDLFIGLSMNRPRDARHTWTRDVVWVRGLTTELDLNRPVPLVTFGEACVYHQLAVKALKKAGFDWETVFTGSGVTSLSRAVVAGLGVMPIVRLRANEIGMLIWEDGPLPKLPDLHTGIYVREGGARVIYEQLADEIAMTMAPVQSDTPELMPALGRARTSAA